MLPRQFKLTNSKGEVLDLLNQNGAMFFEPDGLGFSESADWLQLGTTFRPVNIRSAQRVISGRIIILGENEAYSRYHEFIRFIRSAPLVMEYTIHDTFYIDVRVQSIEKSELTHDGVLDCKIQFVALGPFYKYVKKYVPIPRTLDYLSYIVTNNNEEFVSSNDSFIIASGPDANDRYDYVYSDIYPEENIDTAVMHLDAIEESPVRITIYGPCTKPQWLHYVDGKFVASGKYNGTLAENRMLIVDNTVVPYKIYEKTSDGVYMGDRYGACDFSTERFIFAKPGENRISIGHEDNFGVAFYVEAKLCYESV